MNCLFCCSGDLTARSIRGRVFHFCKNCGGVFLEPSCRLDAEGQRKRYKLHHNNVADEGYRRFLLAFIEPVLAYINSPEGIVPNQGLLRRVLDFGCGPVMGSPDSARQLCPSTNQSSAMVSLLKERLPNVDIRGWDPFFAPETPFFTE
ncbi:MAG: hypothetical protein LBU99_01795, partial [Spirochaetaceae bacterium]|nr:hypothetical protein [Spirochaetaceae bacterium]